MFEDFLLIEFWGKQQFEQFLNGVYSYLSIHMQYPSGRDLTNLQNTIKNDIHQHKRYANSFGNITHRASHLIFFGLLIHLGYMYLLQSAAALEQT